MNPVLFGVFLSPNAAGIGLLREQVQIAERTGFDYVSIQDHPYAPTFLDTLALIGYLLGQTGRLRFMPNVANLPMRPAPMLAKASATLDLVSGGRFELGLGAGRSWEQITGLGGPRFAPGETVAAVDEAITVLHELWRPSRTVSFAGRHYPLTAVQTGRRQRIRSAFGWASAGHGCSTCWAVGRMGGSPRWPPDMRPSWQRRTASTPPRAPRGANRARSAE